MLPSLPLLEKIHRKVKNIPSKQGEYKRQIHHGLFLLCHGAGLRVSEALNFDLATRTKKGLYQITKSKGKKKRFVYIPKQVISELKKNNWQPNQTNRFNFYHFLKSIKKELEIPANIELTPHTLRRSFATYHAENGLPLPLLQKLLGHKSIKTTALYWVNIYNENNDPDDILTAKIWLKKPKRPKSESEVPVNLNLGELPEPSAPNLLASEPPPNYLLTKISQLEQQLNQIQNESNNLKAELSQANEQNANLRTDLTLSQQAKAQEKSHREQIQQELTQAKETIIQLTQELTNEREQKIATKNNLSQQKQNNQSLQETNANLTQQIANHEQNHANLINTYQKALKDKELAARLTHQEKSRADHYETQLKTIFKTLYQWQKINYYQQNEQKAQIIQPPPWRTNK